MPHVVHVLTVPESLAFLRGQAPFLRERGYRLSVITSPGAGLETFGRAEGVGFHAVAMPRRISPGHDLTSLARLTLLLRTLRPDIVHAHTPKGGLLGMLAAMATTVRARVYHMRGLPLMTARGAQRRILRATERTSCALASRVIAVSSSLREVALAERLCSADKISVLAGGSGNGVDSARFDPSLPEVVEAGRALRQRLGIGAEAVVIGFVGRLVRDKGVVELADAFRRLEARHPDAHLVVAGPFEDRDPVPRATRQALLGHPRVHVLGFVEDTRATYAAIDVLALPSYREGFPNVPLEAAAMRVPAVVTRVAGCVDAVVDGETGALVPVGDAPALAAALERYLAEPDLRRTHGRAARARVERSFRRELIWDALAGVYDELLAI